MSNTINTIHYALEIVTDSTLNIPSIGLYNGVFRYITDDYVPADNSAEYENGSPVVDTWERDLLKRNGVQIPSQKIDIVTGGDYSFLSSVNFTLVNINELHKTISNTEDLYVIGAEMRVYVVIDDVFYQRGVVSVSEYKFTDTTFTFIGKDKHNSDNSTISDITYGYSETELLPVVEDADAFLEEQFVKMVSPANDEVVWHNNDGSSSQADVTPVSESGRYVGFTVNSHNLVSTPNKHWVYITGQNDTIVAGMFLSFGSSTELYHITGVNRGSFSTVEGTTEWTRMLIESISSELEDYTNLYGKQPVGVSADIINQTSIADENILSISIYKHGLVFSVPNGANILKDDATGKYIATDEDGNTALLDGYINNEGELIISSTEYTVTKTPKTVRSEVFSWQETGLRDSLESGTMTNADLRGSSTTIPNDFGESGNFTELDYGKYFYFYLDFGENIEDYKIGYVLSGLVDSRENWTTSTLGLIALSPNYDGIPVENRTEYRSDAINTQDLTAYSFFSNWDITSYKIVTDVERGDIPFLKDNIQIPNVRVNLGDSVIPASVGGYPKDIMNFDTESALCTNLPQSSIKSSDSVVTTEKGVINWIDSLDSGYLYPDGKFVEFESVGADSESSGKIMVQMIPYGLNTLSEWDVDIGNETVYDPEGETTRYLSAYGAVFGVNTICAYKVVDITVGTKFSFKTVNDTSTDYETVIKDLSGSSSVLPNRTKWAVGNTISDEENTFNVVTKLCKQGFVAGFTDRTGNVVLRDFLRDVSNLSIHDNAIVKEDTIKGFGLSDISKCYNQFTVKFHQVNGEYQKELGVYNVDADSFPSIGEGGDNWQPPIEIGDGLYRADTVETLQRVGIPKNDTTGVLDDMLNDSRSKYRITLETGETIEFIDPVYENTTSSKVYFYFTRTGGDYVWQSGDILDVGIMEYNTEEVLWKTYVVGVNSYPDAQDLWELAHQSWLINKRIRKAPTERTELEWAVDLDTFYNTTQYDETEEYAYSYFKMLIEWTTRQKLQVSYDLPLTVDTVKLNVVDNVEFNDAIILPNPAEYGSGWITSLGVDTKSDIVKCGITFEPSFFAPPMPQQIGDIIETGSNTDDIIETGSNTDDIIEGN